MDYTVTTADGREIDMVNDPPKWWTDRVGNEEVVLMEYLDYPTDGPLFRQAGDVDPDYDQIQIPTEEFRHAVSEGHIRPVSEHLLDQSEDFIAAMFFGAEASDHVFVFEWSEAVEDENLPRMAWLRYFQQQGETYHDMGLSDVPDWLIARIEDEYELEVVEG